MNENQDELAIDFAVREHYPPGLMKVAATTKMRHDPVFSLQGVVLCELMRRHDVPTAAYHTATECT